MKKGFVFLLSIVMIISMLTGCGTPNTSPDSPSGETIEKTDVALSDVVQAVKDAYGDDYIPSMPIEKEQLADIYSVSVDDIEEFVAEMPMVSVHVDTFIAIKAKTGKGESIEKQLNEYRDYLISNALQYPSNISKVQSSQVVRHGDYVFFVMLGAFNENADATEEDQNTFAVEQVQRGITAIDSCFKK